MLTLGEANRHPVAGSRRRKFRAFIPHMTYVDAALAPLRKTGQIKIHGPAGFEGMRKAGCLAAEVPGSDGAVGQTRRHHRGAGQARL